jgi:hypothetical protein
MGDWADDCERQADFDEEEELDYLRRVNEAQAAVIEAAKALEVARLAEAKAVVEPEEIWAATHYALRKAEQSLTAAVRALLAAERNE